MFIRTKNRIYEVESRRCDGWVVDDMAFIKDDQVIGEPKEKVEDLCDRFIFCDIYWGKESHRCEDRLNALLERYNIIIDETLPCFVENQYYKEDDNFVEIKKGMWLDKDKIEKGVYGAIWTPKGLIYMCKMDFKGKMHLI